MSKVMMPSGEALKAATSKALKDRIGDEVDIFFDAVSGSEAPAPLPATASLVMGAIYGVVKCSPLTEPYNHWHFDESFWGLGVAGVESGGAIITPYSDWNVLFKETNCFHVQGITDEEGILQINWFKGKKILGQYNGLAEGVAVFEAGGRGKWKHHK